MVVTIEGGGSVMKAMDEFGSVLMMAALILGGCAAMDWLFPGSAAVGARSEQADAESSAPQFMAVVHRGRVVLADPGSVGWVVAAPDPYSDHATQPGLAARTSLPQQTRLSW